MPRSMCLVEQAVGVEAATAGLADGGGGGGGGGDGDGERLCYRSKCSRVIWHLGRAFKDREREREVSRKDGRMTSGGLAKQL